MKYLIWGLVILAILLIANYLQKRKAERNRVNKLISEPLSSISEEERLQDQNNCRYVTELIH
jgi:uncharacterized protein YxeA